jgi:hypothetical protein
LLFKDLTTFSKFVSVKIAGSVEEAESLSEDPVDFVGEGGKGILLGVRLRKSIASENLVGEDGGVKS